MGDRIVADPVTRAEGEVTEGGGEVTGPHDDVTTADDDDGGGGEVTPRAVTGSDVPRDDFLIGAKGGGESAESD